MFYMLWIVLIIVTLVASIGLFIWAFRSGQFSEQGRARYLPLREGPPDLKEAHLPAKELYALLAIMAGTFALFVYTLVLLTKNGV